MRDVLLTPDELEKQKAAEQAQAQPQPGPTPPGGMAKPIQGTPNEDTISTGGMPPGVEPPPMALPEGGAGVTLPNALCGQYSGF